MSITHYNKLVRDKIPEIIEREGKKANYRILSKEEFDLALKAKLVEEALELQQAKTQEECAEELADIYEVLEYLTYDDAEVISDNIVKKREERGRFGNRIFLRSVEERP